MRIPLTMSSCVTVHVAIGGKGLSTNVARERPFTRMDQHVSVQGTEGRKHFATQAAVVDLGLTSWIIGIILGLDLIVSSDVGCKVSLAGKDTGTEGTLKVVWNCGFWVGCVLSGPPGWLGCLCPRGGRSLAIN